VSRQEGWILEDFDPIIEMNARPWDLDQRSHLS